jgi:hypothetical protein
MGSGKDNYLLCIVARALKTFTTKMFLFLFFSLLLPGLDPPLRRS